MKFTDIQTNEFIGVATITEAELLQYVASFTLYLQYASLLPANSANDEIKAYATNVAYDDYVNTFNNYWASQPVRAKVFERLLIAAIQAVSLLFGQTPPEKTFFRDIARAKVAKKLLTI